MSSSCGMLSSLNGKIKVRRGMIRNAQAHIG